MEKYDVIIIGGGPAGLTAGIYAARFKLKTLIFEGEVMGGQMALTPKIENYPGIESTNGMELAAHMAKQAKNFGTEIKTEKVTDFEIEGEKKVKTNKGEYTCDVLILATGAAHRKLGIKGEEEFIGKGVSFCAACDAPFFKEKTVAVIGGGSSALTAALYIADYAKKTYIVHRRQEFRGEPILVERINKNEKIEKVLDSVLDEVKGKEVVTSMVVKNVKTEEKKEIPLDGVFIYVGVVPTAAIAKNRGVALDEKGFIKVNEKMETNKEGVYACGDVTGRVLQVASAVGEGCTAAWYAYPYIKELKKK
jgi:thioredoxin reductase (NADPH)